MFGRATILLCIILCACAKPNYQDTANPVSPSEKMTQGPCEKSFRERRCSLQLKSEGLCAEIEWEQAPSETAMASFHLCTMKNAEPQNPSSPLAIQLWMPAMGHGSRPVRLEKRGTGQYYVDKVYFIMPGIWEIRIQLKEGSRVLDQDSQIVEI